MRRYALWCLPAILTLSGAACVLVGEDGQLRFYRDQAAGPGGYTVRLDPAAYLPVSLERMRPC